jgi:SAM-dependent methyltransferase
VSAVIPDLVADLAALRPRPDLGATIWRHPALALRLYQPAVAHALQAAAGRHRVLDVGSGYGTVALELARAGHAVTALEPDTVTAGVTRRTLAGVQAAVVEARFGEDGLHEGSFDVVRFGRSLHHLPDVGAAAERAALLLAPGGVIVIDEFCAERIESTTAHWLCSLAASLTAAGTIADSGLDDPDALVAMWERKRGDHHLATGEQMWRALEARFVLVEPDWYPYLWQFAARAVGDPTLADLVARQVESRELALIANETIPGVAFRTTGAVR